MVNGWKKIDNSKIKSKSWIFREYAKVFDGQNVTMLIYDDKENQPKYAKWVVWIGKSEGIGQYNYKPTQKEAMKFAMDEMRKN